jgi:peptide/nickel transport system substrate-binding protein
MKRYWSIVLLVVLALGYGGCATPTPQVIEKEVIKTVEVVETVEVVKEVEKEIVVTPTATPEPAPLAPKEGGTLNLHLELAPPSLYPPYDMDRSSRMVYELVYDYLFFFNDAQEVVPELGKAYEVSADGLTYTITLRDDVKWHDGEPFTAKDVKFTFEVACSEASPLYGDYSKIVGCADFHEGNAQEVEGIQIVDDYTVKLVLAEPNAAFPIALVYQVVPEHIYAGMDLDTAKRTAWQLVGTGPFKFVKYVEDQYFEFDANPDYFKGKPHIDKVFMKIADVDTAIAMLEKGEVDFIADLPATEVDRLSENPNVSILETPNTNWPWILEYNFKSEKLKDKRVRQAFMYAVDRQAYVDSILQGHGQVYNQPFLFPGWAAPPDA